MRDLIEQAHKAGITRDQLKSEIMKQLAVKPKYRLTGARGDKRLGEDAGEIFSEIDKHWKEIADHKTIIQV